MAFRPSADCIENIAPQDPSQKTFQGDNFVRRAGDFDSFQALNLHSVAAMNRGQDISMMVRMYCPVGKPCGPLLRM